MPEPIIRVVRTIEYVGPASRVKNTLDRSYVTMDGVYLSDMTLREISREYSVVEKAEECDA